jgi:hypothetical protein
MGPNASLSTSFLGLMVKKLAFWGQTNEMCHVNSLAKEAIAQTLPPWPTR